MNHSFFSDIIQLTEVHYKHAVFFMILLLWTSIMVLWC